MRYRSCLVALIISTTLIVGQGVQAKENPSWIQEKLDFFVSECADHWDEYHVYPSTMAMIAAQESFFGKYGRSYNLWGLACGRASYGSFEEGIHAFMQCVNNGYYPGAPEADSGDEQLAILLDHGYCQPPGRYFSYAMSLKASYNLGILDERMFEIIKKNKRKEARKLRKKRQKKPFTPVYEDEIDEGVIYVDPKWVKSGVVQIGWNYYDVKPRKGLKSRFLINDENMVRWHSDIMFDAVIENARG